MKNKPILLGLLAIFTFFALNSTSAQTHQNLMPDSINPISHNIRWDSVDVVITSNFISSGSSAYYVYSFENKNNNEVLISIESIFPGILRLAPKGSETMLYVSQSTSKPATLAVVISIFTVSGEKKIDFKNTAGLFFSEGLLSWLSDGFYEKYYGDRINIYVPAGFLKQRP